MTVDVKRLRLLSLKYITRNSSYFQALLVENLLKFWSPFAGKIICIRCKIDLAEVIRAEQSGSRLFVMQPINPGISEERWGIGQDITSKTYK